MSGSWNLCELWAVPAANRYNWRDALGHHRTGLSPRRTATTGEKHLGIIAPGCPRGEPLQLARSTWASSHAVTASRQGSLQLVAQEDQVVVSAGPQNGDPATIVMAPSDVLPHVRDRHRSS